MTMLHRSLHPSRRSAAALAVAALLLTAAAADAQDSGSELPPAEAALEAAYDALRARTSGDQPPAGDNQPLGAQAGDADPGLSLAEAQSFAKLGEAVGEEEEEAEQRVKRFIGLDWDLGVGVAYDLEGTRIDGAKVVDGKVRVETAARTAPRLVAAIHHFWPMCPGDAYCNDDVNGNPHTAEGLLEEAKNMRWGWGPFVGIQSSQDDLVDAFAAGLMVGWPMAKNGSFNIGLGLVLDGKVTTLGDGIEADRPLPSGDTEVRFKTEDRLGALLLFTFNR